MSQHDQSANVGAVNDETGTTTSTGPRDAKGRFAKGNAIGTGNPFGRTMASRRTTILNAVSEADLAEIMQELVRLAKGGDIGAAKLVLQYVVGKPLPAKDPDQIEIEEWQIHKNSVVMEPDMNSVSAAVAAPLGNKLANLAKWVNEEKTTQAMLDQLDPNNKPAPTEEEDDDDDDEGINDPADKAAHEQFWLETLATIQRNQAAAKPAAPSNAGSNGHAAPPKPGNNGHHPSVNSRF